jgi:hypothetical protein
MSETDKPKVNREDWNEKIRALDLSRDSHADIIRDMLMSADDEIIEMILESETKKEGIKTTGGIRFFQLVMAKYPKLTHAEYIEKFGFVRNYFLAKQKEIDDTKRPGRWDINRTLKSGE